MVLKKATCEVLGFERRSVNATTYPGLRILNGTLCLPTWTWNPVTWAIDWQSLVFGWPGQSAAGIGTSL